ncbi:MAG: hypothetical protein ACHQ9S_12935 [Candidatus Binatia bacterium]
MAHFVASRKIHFVVAAAVLAITGLAGSRTFDFSRAVATGNTITIVGADSLGGGLQDVYRLQLSDPSPGPSGLQVTLTSGSGCMLAPTEYSVGTPSLPITIPAGQQSASFVVQTVDGASGGCQISVNTTNPTGWSTPAVTIALVQGKLRIRDLAHHIGALDKNDPFFVEAGVPAADGTHLRYVQGRSMQSATTLEITVCSDQPTIGQIADVYRDESPSGCEQNPIIAPFSRTVPGDFQFDPITGNDSVDVHVTASAPGFLGDTQTVDVPSLALTIRGPGQLGAGLQDDYSVTLSAAVTSATTIAVSVVNPPGELLCAVAASEQSLGETSIQIIVPAGNTRANFVVQGVTGAPVDWCTINATTTVNGMTPSDNLEIAVQTPGLRIRSLSSTEGQFGPDDPFYVELGVPGAGLRTLRYVQELARGLDPAICTGTACGGQQLPVTGTSNQPTIGTIVNSSGQGGAQQTAYVPLTYSRTVPGDLTFHPVSGSSTPVHVTVTAPGFVTIDASAKDVTVQSAVVQIKPVLTPGDLGWSLEDEYRVKLIDANGHPNTNVTISSDPNCLVAPNLYSPGLPSIVVPIDQYHTSARFTVQAAALPDSTCHITAAATNYVTGTFDVPIVVPGIQIRQLSHIEPLDVAKDPFYVEVGLPNRNNTALRRPQKVVDKVNTFTISVSACSSVPSVGTINGSPCATDVIYASYSNNTPGDFAFDPVSIGRTVVTASAPGFLTMDPAGIVPVQVGTTTLDINPPAAIGSGLQASASVALSQPAGTGGVVVTITSLTPNKCVVAPDANTPGAPSIPLPIPANGTSATFYVAAFDNLGNDTCTLTATASGYISDQTDINIEQCSFQILNLDPTLGTGSAPTPFTVAIGVIAGGQFIEQAVLVGSSGEPVNVCSSNTSVGTINNSTNGCASGMFQAGQSELTFNFDVNPADTTRSSTTVSATGDCLEDDQTEQVSPTVAHLPLAAPVLGKDLQETYFVTINNNNGATVTVHAEPCNVCVVSLDPTQLGDCTDKTVTIPNGSTRGSFVLQALNLGTCNVTLSGSGFPSVTRAIPVNPTRLRISALAAKMSFLAPADDFYVENGPENTSISYVQDNSDNSHGITQPLPRRAGSVLSGNVCSSNVNVGIIYDMLFDPVILPPPGQPQCQSFHIQPNSSRSDQDDFFGPVNTGSDTVFAYALNPADIDPTQFTVTVQPGSLSLAGPSQIGVNLEDSFTLRFYPAPASGTTATIAVTGPCGVSQTDNPPANQPPANQITLPVPSGQASVSFWIQSFGPGTCSINASSNVASYGSVPSNVGMNNPGDQITGVDTTRSSASAPDPFSVQFGSARSSLTGLQYVQEVRAENTTAGYGLPYQNTGSNVFGIPFQVCSSNPGAGSVTGCTPDPINSNCQDCVVQQLSSSVSLSLVAGLQGGTTCVSVNDYGTLLQPTSKSTICVNFVASTIGMSDEHALGNGLQDDYQIALSTPAIGNGTISIAASANCLVAPTQTGTFGPTTTVPIASGHTRASFSIRSLVQNVQPSALTPCTITASINLPGYTPVPEPVPVVQPALRIINLDNSRTLTQSDDPFNVEIGVPPQGRTLTDNPQISNVQNAGTQFTVSVCSSNPAAATILNCTGSPTCCIPVAIAAGVSQTAKNALIIHGGGLAGLTVISASAPLVIPAQEPVNVAPIVTNITNQPVGAGLEDQRRLYLSAAAAQDTTFGVYTTSAACTLSVNETDVGTGTPSSPISLTVPAGRTQVYFWVHGIENTGGGDCPIYANTTVPGVTSGYTDIAIPLPGLAIINLASSIKATSSDDSFNVEIGVPRQSLTGLADITQVARCDGPGIPIKVCNLIPPPPLAEVGSIVGQDSTGCVNATILACKGATLNGVLAFHAGSNPGTTTVSTTSLEAISTTAAYKDVTVSLATLNLSGEDTIGSGLEDTFTVTANPAAPSGGLPITLSSLTPSLCLVARDEATAAPLTYDANNNQIYATSIAGGHTNIHFAIQAVENVVGLCRVTVSSTNTSYSTDEIDVVIAQPGVRISNLDLTTTVSAANEPFNADLGVPQASLNNLRLVQAVRPGGPGYVNVQVCSMTPAVGVIVNGSGTPNCLTVQVIAGNPSTPSSGSNSLAFNPVASGSTQVIASATGFITVANGHPTVVVAPVTLAFKSIDSTRVGSGLMDKFTLKASSAVSVDTSVTVSTPLGGPCLLAPDNATAAASSITVTIASGHSSQTFYIHGLEGATGQCALQAHDPTGSLSDGFGSYDIVEPAVSITSVSLSKTVSSGDDAFYVNVGVPNAALSTLSSTGNQVVRYGSSGFGVTVCSSDPSVGLIVSSTGADVCGSATIAVNANNTASTDLKFRVAGNGTTTISPPVPNPVYIVTDAGSQDITVTGFSVTLSNSSSVTTVGAGLEQGTFTITRDGNYTAPATITVVSLTTSVCLVSSSGSVAGGNTASITIPVGAASATFWIQALEGATGLTCQVQTLGPYYTPQSTPLSVGIVQPAIQIINLPASVCSSTASNFNVQVGIASGTTFQAAQAVRAGGPGYTITLLLTDAAGTTTHPAELVSGIGASPGQQVTTAIPWGSSTNTALLQFQPLATGTTTCSASGTGVIATGTASVTVTVGSCGC